MPQIRPDLGAQQDPAPERQNPTGKLKYRLSSPEFEKQYHGAGCHQLEEDGPVPLPGAGEQQLHQRDEQQIAILEKVNHRVGVVGAQLHGIASGGGCSLSASVRGRQRIRRTFPRP